MWQLFTYATDDGKAIAEYRVDGAWAVVRVDGRERPPIPEKRDDAKRVSAPSRQERAPSRRPIGIEREHAVGVAIREGARVR